MRSGTLPTPLVVGLGVAAKIAGAEMQQDNARIRYLSEKFLKAVMDDVPDVFMNGDREQRIDERERRVAQPKAGRQSDGKQDARDQRPSGRRGRLERRKRAGRRRPREGARPRRSSPTREPEAPAGGTSLSLRA